MCGDPAANPELEGQNNVIKLHGSFKWRTADSRNTLVVGTAKTGQIAALKLLAWYHDIFRRVLRAGEVRLLNVGYGFADEHINEVIAEAQNHGLKVLIWDVGANLRERVRAAPHGAAIWDAVLSTASRPMIDVFQGCSHGRMLKVSLSGSPPQVIGS